MNDPQLEGHMASHIGRRTFLATLGAAAAWPRAARAQQPAMPVIGMIRSRLPETEPGSRMIAFRQGLNESGSPMPRRPRWERFIDPRCLARPTKIKNARRGLPCHSLKRDFANAKTYCTLSS